MHPALRKIDKPEKLFLSFFQQYIDGGEQITSLNSDIIDACIKERPLSKVDIGFVSYFNSKVSCPESAEIMQSIISVMEGEHLLHVRTVKSELCLSVGTVMSRRVLSNLIGPLLERGYGAAILEISHTGALWPFYDFDTGFYPGHSFSLDVQHRARWSIEEILLAGPHGDSWRWRVSDDHMMAPVPLVKRI